VAGDRELSNDEERFLQVADVLAQAFIEVRPGYQIDRPGVAMKFLLHPFAESRVRRRMETSAGVVDNTCRHQFNWVIRKVRTESSVTRPPAFR